MDFQDILFDVSDGIATITLNRPDKLNAFTGRMMYEIIAALDLSLIHISEPTRPY